MRVIFKWVDVNGLRMSSPRELDAIPRAGEWVCPDRGVELVASEFRWLAYSGDVPCVLIYLEARRLE